MKVIQTIGLFAGSGDLPLIFLERVKKGGDKKVVTVAIEPYNHKLKELSDDFYSLPIANLLRSIEIFLNHNVSQLFTLGKVDIRAYLKAKDKDSDPETMSFIKELEDGRESSLLNLFKEKLKEYKIPIENARKYFHPEFVREGVLTSRSPSEEEELNIKYGIQVLKELARIDTFQTIVVKKRKVCAVETVEGTDEAILRGGELAGEGTVVVKIANLNHEDSCFHIPVVGYNTLKSMIKADATALAIESEKVYILEKDKIIKEANRHKIAIKAVKIYNQIN